MSKPESRGGLFAWNETAVVLPPQASEVLGHYRNGDGKYIVCLFDILPTGHAVWWGNTPHGKAQVLIPDEWAFLRPHPGRARSGRMYSGPVTGMAGISSAEFKKRYGEVVV